MFLLKILLYIVYGVLFLAPVFILIDLILIPIVAAVRIKRVRHGIYDDGPFSNDAWDDQYMPDGGLYPEKEIQWIVREPTEHEMRKGR